MPRVNSLDPIQNMMRKLTALIRQEMKDQKVTQADMGRELNMSQQYFSKMLADGTLKADQLLRILYKLKAFDLLSEVTK